MVELSELGRVLSNLDQRLQRIEQLLSSTARSTTFQKEWYSVAEAAKLLEKRPFTIREWCRLNRIEASKRKCGRGRTSEWVVSRDEIERYMNEGLLPQHR